MMSLTVIILCFWAIVLELTLRKKEKGLMALSEAVVRVADGEYVVIRNRNGEVTFKKRMDD